MSDKKEKLSSSIRTDNQKKKEKAAAERIKEAGKVDSIKPDQKKRETAAKERIKKAKGTEEKSAIS